MLIIVDDKNKAHIIDQTNKIKHIAICGISCRKNVINTLAMNNCSNMCESCNYYYAAIYGKNYFKSSIPDIMEHKISVPEIFHSKYQSLLKYKFWNKLNKFILTMSKPKFNK